MPFSEISKKKVKKRKEKGWIQNDKIHTVEALV